MNCSLSRLIGVLFLPGFLLCLFAGSVWAQIERQHGAHVHGQARGQLALEGAELHLRLEIPGVNLVGFEHAPDNDERRARLEEVVDLLVSGHWLEVDERGQCSPLKIQVTTPGFGQEYDRTALPGEQAEEKQDVESEHAAQQAGDRAGKQTQADQHRDRHQQRHEHDHDHDHNPRHGHHNEHASFEIVARLDCKTVQHLRWVDIGLFGGLPGNETITVDVLTERMASQAHLRRGQERIPVMP